MSAFTPESPLALQLQQLVQPKLAEFGWTTGGDDTTLFDYILLMLANDKDETQVAQELSSDLLDLGPENTETQQFAQWLFQQIEALKQQINGGGAQTAAPTEDQMNSSLDDGSAAQDTEMEGAGDSSQGIIPTGPKAMRNGSGSGAQANRPARGGGRMLNQLNKNMRNDDSPLHRVRGASGVGRTNSHGGPPKGPRGQNIGRGIEAMANGRGMGNANMNMGPGMNGMPMGGMPSMPGMPPMGGQNGMSGMLNPQQQMALMQMYEQQAQMMQQIFSGASPAGFVNPNFNQNNRGGPKKSLQQRIDRPARGGMNPSTKFTPKKEGTDTEMGGATENGDSMEVEATRPDHSSTMCRFNLKCSNPDCHFVHQSPAAPPGTTVDMNQECEFGAACKNRKCVGKHPSPAQRNVFKSEQECAFYPNCRDQENCPFKHPTERPCRHGADCTVENCPFYHIPTKCKFNPCLNQRCIFKHEPGQKKIPNNKWVAGQEKEHVSERKFVDETVAEEQIIPGQTPANEGVATQS